MKMHIMYAGPYHVGFSERSSKRWFHCIYWGSVGWVLSGKVHKRTVFGNIALVLINQGFPLDYSCRVAALRRAFLQSSVRVVKFSRTRSFSSLGCVVVLVEQMLKHGMGSSVGSVAPGPAHCWGPAKSCWMCVTEGYTHAAVWLTCLLWNRTSEKWVTEPHQQVPGFESWALGKW